MNPSLKNLKIEGFNPTIFGRIKEVQKYSSLLLTSHRPLCLHGIGGIGKTTLAKEIYRQKREHIPYSVLLTVTDSIAKALLTHPKLRTCLDIKFTAEEEQSPDFERYAVEIILNKMRGLPTAAALNKENPEADFHYHLLIIDNLTNETKDLDFIQKLDWYPEWRVLLTSRFPIAIAENYAIERIDLEAACALFKTHCKRAENIDKPLLEAIISLLHQHPLSVEVVAKHTQIAKSLTFEDLHKKLSTHSRADLSQKTVELKDYKKETEQTNMVHCLTVCFDISQLSSEKLTAFNLLKYLSLLPSRLFSFAALNDLFNTDDLFTTDELENALSYLCKTGWLTESADSYFLHGAIADFFLDYHLQFPSESEKIAFINPFIYQLIGMAKKEETTDYLQRQAFLELLPRVEHFIDGIESKEIGAFYNEIGVLFGLLSNYNKQLVYYKKALAICLNVLGENHEDTATAYNNLGYSYEKNGDNRNGLEYKEKALAIRVKILGENHINTANSYNNLGISYEENGDRKKGIEYLEKSLAILLNLFGKNHADTARSYNNLGYSYEENGDRQKGLEYKEKALAIRLKVLGENHTDTAQSYNNLGMSYTENGDRQKGIVYLKKALAIQLKILGENHEDTAQSYINLGVSYTENGDTEKGLEYLEKALAIRINLFGENHADTANSYHNVGIAYYQLNQKEKALAYIEKAYQISKSILREEHPDTVDYKENRDFLYNELHKK